MIIHPRRVRTRSIIATAMLLGCSHSDAFVTDSANVPPSGTGADVRLTFNSEQDYWPAWTQDGQGILYAYANPGIPANPQHRCVGILPAAGGTRLWQFCDDRAVRSDTVSSFTGFALATDGRLLYAEAVAPRSSSLVPRVTLFVIDTAHPLVRTELLSLPVAPGSPITWLSELTWTGPGSFMALGQQFGTGVHCAPPCAAPPDSTFANWGGVVAGTIAGGRATLSVVPGTDSATGYSLAEGGASIVFIRRDDGRLYKVPVGGGTPLVIATVSQDELGGVSCRGSTCVVATNPMSLFYGGSLTSGQVFPALRQGPHDLVGISLTTGLTQVLKSMGTAANAQIVMTPVISPASGDVVAQVGGTVWGHLQTFLGVSNADLHLYPALVP